MFAVFERDFRAFFNSPIGYVFVAGFLSISNLFFFMLNVLSASSDITPLFMNMLTVLMFLAPLLTMRLFSEELRSKTDQLLLTSPLRLGSIVLGKFLAAMSVFLIALAFTSIWVVLVALYGDVQLWSIIGNYIAIIFAASVFVAVGLFVSALTESQIIAAVTSFAIFFGIYVLDYAAAAIDISVVRQVIGWFSIFVRFSGFTRGIFFVSDIIYYFCFTAVFLFLAVRVLERRRWS